MSDVPRSKYNISMAIDVETFFSSRFVDMPIWMVLNFSHRFSYIYRYRMVNVEWPEFNTLRSKEKKIICKSKMIHSHRTRTFAWDWSTKCGRNFEKESERKWERKRKVKIKRKIAVQRWRCGRTIENTSIYKILFFLFYLSFFHRCRHIIIDTDAAV